MTKALAARALMPHAHMTRRDWWLSVVVAVIAVALLLFPLYQWRADTAERTVEDTGEELGLVEGTPPAGEASVPDPDALSGGVEIQIPLPIIKSEAVVKPDELNDLSRPLAGVRAAPQNIVNRARATCADDGAVRPRSGAEPGGKEDSRGAGKLQIDNRTGWDAVATLIEDPDGTPRRAIFIHNGARGVIASIRSGRYRLRFQSGADCPGGRRLCRQSDTSESDEAFDFREVSPESGSGSTTYHVTLHKHVAPAITSVAVPAASSRFCIS
jgi:hypothetical protein